MNYREVWLFEVMLNLPFFQGVFCWLSCLPDFVELGSGLIPHDVIAVLVDQFLELEGKRALAYLS
jgi:hypothetical protein